MGVAYVAELYCSTLVFGQINNISSPPAKPEKRVISHKILHAIILIHSRILAILGRGGNWVPQEA